MEGPGGQGLLPYKEEVEPHLEYGPTWDRLRKQGGPEVGVGVGL